MLELSIGRAFAAGCAAVLSAAVGLPGLGQTVYVEDSPAALELSQRALQWRAQGRLSEAVGVLMALSETYPGKLMPAPAEAPEGEVTGGAAADAGRYVDVTAWVRRTLSGDAALREAYLREAEPAAARALAAALERPGREPGEWFDATALSEVGRGYWSTPSGLSANLAWCAVMLEGGQAGAALSKLESLREHPSLGEASRGVRHAELLAAAEAQLARRAAWWSERAAGDRAAARDVSLVEPVWTAWWEQMELLAEPAGLTPVDADGQLVEGGFGGDVWFEGVVLDGPLPANLLQQRGNVRGLRSGVNPLGLQADGALGGDAVYVSDGRFVASVDRSSGRPRWAVGWPGLWSPMMNRGQPLQDRRGVLMLPDVVLAVLGPAEAARPRMVRGGMMDEGVSQGLWCVDRQTGATRWRVLPEELGEGMSGAQFVGVPVAATSEVLAVGVRRVQNSGFVDAFVVGLDAGTGAVLWTRHLVSTADTGGTGTLPVATPMVVSDGRLFVDDGLGVVASVDPRNGGLHWLRVLTPEAARGGAEALEAEGEAVVDRGEGELPAAVRRALVNPARASVQGRTGPAVLEAGLLVAELSLGTERDAALLLDPATGRLLERLTAESAPWVQGARWHVAKDERSATADNACAPLLVHSDRLWLIDGEDLSVRWRDERTTNDDASAWPPLIDGESVYLTSQGTLRRFELRTGPPGESVAWDVGSRLLGQGGEVFRVSAQGVSGMVSPTWGESRLRRRIIERAEVQPGDAEPGLSLATLGVATGKAKLLLDGVGAALRALGPQAQPDPQAPSATSSASALTSSEVDALLAAYGGQDGRLALGDEASASSAVSEDVGVSVVLELIDLIAEAEALSPAVRRAAFDRVAAAVTGPEELVAYHLAMGPLEREAGRPAEAIEHFQAVLQDPLLAAQAPRMEGAKRQAGLEARSQLTSLIAEAGFVPYAPFDALARTELDRLRLEAPRDAERFESLADRFPLAIASAEALTQAGDLRAESPTPRLAIRAYQRAYRAARSAEPRDRAAGRLAELYLALDRPDMARGWLRRVKQEFPMASPWIDRQPAAASAWDARLAELGDPVPSLPAFDATATLTPWTMQGTLVPVHPDAEATLRRDLAVLRFRGDLTVVDPSQRRAVLEVDLSARDADVRRFSDDQLVLVSSQRGEFILIDVNRPDDPPVSLAVQPALDAVPIPAADNTQLEDFDAVLDAERMDLERLRRLRQVQQAERFQQNQILITQRGGAGVRYYAVNDGLLIAADTVGRVVAFDRFTGDVQWSFAQPRAAVTGLVATDDAIVLTGLSAPGTEAQQGLTLVLDPLTGQPQGPPIFEASDAPLDARPMPDGSLLVTYPRFVAAYAPPDHRLLWRTPKPFDTVANFLPPPVFGSPGDGVLAMKFPPGAPTLLLLDPDTGRTQRQLTLNPQLVRARQGGADIQAADGRVHLLLDTPQAFHADGRPIWRAVIDDPAMTPMHQSLAGDHVLVLSETTEVLGPVLGPRAIDPANQAMIANQAIVRTYLLHAYERDTGRLVAEHPVDAGRATVNPNAARLFDHAYAVAVGSQTVFLSDLP